MWTSSSVTHKYWSFKLSIWHHCCIKAYYSR